ncbi:MAG: DUF3047 domain-containing protein [Gemmatimonadaceae bacterium]|nr:DUF3047 domain-containing protein [Gemmatimonadaceae bacterium]
MLVLLAGLLTQPLDLLSLAHAPLRVGPPPGWKVRNIRGQNTPEIELRNDGEGPVLRIQGAGRAAWFYHELSTQLNESSGSLSWSWRVLQAPAGADLRQEQTDDSPLRVYVVFGKPGLFGRSSRVIFYTFGATEPEGYERASFVSDKLHVIRVGGTADVGQWRAHSVRPFADYRRVWRRQPPPITAVGVMQDTDQTRANAVAELRRLEWLPP